jgi:hypothetical protein
MTQEIAVTYVDIIVNYGNCIKDRLAREGLSLRRQGNNVYL